MLAVALGAFRRQRRDVQVQAGASSPPTTPPEPSEQVPREREPIVLPASDEPEVDIETQLLDQVGRVPAIPESRPARTLRPLEDPSSQRALTQSQIDTYCASSAEFWRATTRGLGAAYSTNGEFAKATPEEWSAKIKEAPAGPAIETLARFVMLKGEALIEADCAIPSGRVILTNYRLLLSLGSLSHNIPLYDLEEYGPAIRYVADGHPVSVGQISSALVTPELVQEVKEANEFDHLGKTAQRILTSSRKEIENTAPAPALPQLDFL
jgi:hypothetical protein